MPWPRLPPWFTATRLRVIALGALTLLLVLVLALAVYSSVALSRFERVEARRVR